MSLKFNQIAAAGLLSGSLLTPLYASAQDTNVTPSPPSDKEIMAENLFDQAWLERLGSPVDFDNTWMLLGLLSLPAVWYVLRSDPLKPVEAEFGPMVLLEQLQTHEAHPSKMPLWKQSLFLSSVTAATLAAAGPHSNATSNFGQDGSVLIAIDSGWASAPNWNNRREAARELIRHAHNQERNIVFLNMAEGKNGEPVQLTKPMNAALALSYIDTLKPVPWKVDRQAAAQELEMLNGTFGATVWMSNGLQDNHALALSSALSDIAPLTVYDDPDLPYLMMPPVYRNNAYQITVKRADIGDAREITVAATDQGRNILGRVTAGFSRNETQTQMRFDMADHNASADQIFKFSIDNENGVGGMALVNENHKPRSVGIAVRNKQIDTQSLFSETRFLQAALAPYTELYFGNISELIDSDDISVLIIPDAMPLNPRTRKDVEQWTQNGGQTIRFAGPNLADSAHIDDPLLPVNVRKGTRAMIDSIAAGGDNDLTIPPFDRNSPYTGLNIDNSIAVTQQLIVEPTANMEDKIWARFSDGSPLVTADRRGDGQVVLFHTTANTSWSDLPLSSDFVAMLVATIGQSNSIEDITEHEYQDLSPLSILNAKGELRDPAPVVAPLNQSVINEEILGPKHPPGLYGTNLMTVPYNVSDSVTELTQLQPMPEKVTRESYSHLAHDHNIRGWLWGGAVGLLLAASLVLARPGQARRQQETAEPEHNANTLQHDQARPEPGHQI